MGIAHAIKLRAPCASVRQRCSSNCPNATPIFMSCWTQHARNWHQATCNNPRYRLPKSRFYLALATRATSLVHSNDGKGYRRRTTARIRGRSTLKGKRDNACALLLAAAPGRTALPSPRTHRPAPTTVFPYDFRVLDYILLVVKAAGPVLSVPPIALTSPS